MGNSSSNTTSPQSSLPNKPSQIIPGSVLYQRYIELLIEARKRASQDFSNSPNLSQLDPYIIHYPLDSITILNYQDDGDCILKTFPKGTGKGVRNTESIAPVHGIFALTPLDLIDPQWEIFKNLPNRDFFRYLAVYNVQKKVICHFLYQWRYKLWIQGLLMTIETPYPCPPKELTFELPPPPPVDPPPSSYQDDDSAQNNDLDEDKFIKLYQSPYPELFSPLYSMFETKESQDRAGSLFRGDRGLELIVPQVHQIPFNMIPYDACELFVPSPTEDVMVPFENGENEIEKVNRKGSNVHLKTFPEPYTIQPNSFINTNGSFNPSLNHLPYISVSLPVNEDMDYNDRYISPSVGHGEISRCGELAEFTTGQIYSELLFPLRSSNISTQFRPSPKGIVKVDVMELDEFETKGLWKKMFFHLPPTRISCISVSIDTTAESPQNWDNIHRCIDQVTKSIKGGQSHLGLEKCNVHIFAFGHGLEHSDSIEEGYSKKSLISPFINAGFPLEQLHVHYLQPHVLPFPRDHLMLDDEQRKRMKYHVTDTSDRISKILWNEIFATFFKIQLEKLHFERLILQYPNHHTFWMNYNRWPNDGHVTVARSSGNIVVMQRIFNHYLSASTLIAIGSDFSTRLLPFLAKKSPNSKNYSRKKEKDEKEFFHKRLIKHLQSINSDTLPKKQHHDVVYFMTRIYGDYLSQYNSTDVNENENENEVNNIDNNKGNEPESQPSDSPLITHPHLFASPSNPDAPFVLLCQDGLDGNEIIDKGFYASTAPFLFAQFSEVEKKIFLQRRLFMEQNDQNNQNDEKDFPTYPSKPDNHDHHSRLYPVIPTDSVLRALGAEGDIDSRYYCGYPYLASGENTSSEDGDKNTHNSTDIPIAPSSPGRKNDSISVMDSCNDDLGPHFEFKGYICNRYPYLFQVTPNPSPEQHTTPPVYTPTQYGKSTNSNIPAQRLHPTSLLISSREVYDYCNSNDIYSFHPDDEWKSLNIIKSSKSTYRDRQIIDKYNPYLFMIRSPEGQTKDKTTNASDSRVAVMASRNPGEHGVGIVISTPSPYQIKHYSISPSFETQVYAIFPSPSNCRIKSVDYNSTVDRSRLDQNDNDQQRHDETSPLLKFFSPCQQSLIIKNSLTPTCSRIKWTMRHDHIIIPDYLKTVLNHSLQSQTPQFDYITGIHLFEYNHELCTDIDYFVDPLLVSHKTSSDDDEQMDTISKKLKEQEEKESEEQLDITRRSHPLHHLEQYFKVPYLTPISSHLNTTTPPDSTINITRDMMGRESDDVVDAMKNEWKRLNQVAKKLEETYHNTTIFEPYQITSISQDTYASTYTLTSDNVSTDGFNNTLALTEATKTFCNGKLLSPSHVIFIVPPSPQKMSSNNQPSGDDIKSTSHFADYSELTKALMTNYPNDSVGALTIANFREKLNTNCQRQLDLLWKKHHFGIPSTRISNLWNFHLIAHDQLEQTLVQIQSSAVLERLKLYGKAVSGQ